MSDWAVGDLAVGDENLPYCLACELDVVAGVDGRDGPDGPALVIGVTSPNPWLRETELGLVFAAHGEMCSCQYRKIVPDKHEDCELEFVDLLKRSKKPAKVDHYIGIDGDD